MKKLFLLLSAAVFFLFSCASVQDKGDAEDSETELAENIEGESIDADTAGDDFVAEEEADTAGDDFVAEEEADTASDDFIAEDEADGEAKADVAETSPESEAADFDKREASPERQGQNPSLRAIPLGQGRPRPLPNTELPHIYARPDSESSVAAAPPEEQEEAALPLEEEPPDLGEEEPVLLTEEQAAPPVRMAEAQPEQPAEPAQAAPPVRMAEAQPAQPDEPVQAAPPVRMAEAQPAQPAEPVQAAPPVRMAEAQPEQPAEPVQAAPPIRMAQAQPAGTDVAGEPEVAVLDAGEERSFEERPPSVAQADSNEEAALEDEASEIAEEEPPPPEPSRSVSLSAGQNLEVWYPGQGWVFSGFRESSSPGGMTFSSRRLENRDTIFSFRALRPGRYIITFSRFDVLSGGYIEDSLLAEVLAEGAIGGDGGRALSRGAVVRAPDYGGVRIRAIPQEMRENLEGETESNGEAADEPSVTFPPARQPLLAEEEPPATEGALSYRQALPEVAEAEARAVFGGAPQDEESEAPAEISSIETGSPVAQGSIEERETSGHLNEIHSMMEAGDIEAAISAIDSFFAEYAADTDEALFLLGQAYEADSPSRDIRRALSAYETLTSNYPLSRFWQEADKRIRYIRRFYFDIR